LPPISKPEPRKRVKARTQRQHAAARAKCITAVWKRSENHCELCHRYVQHPRLSEWWVGWGHVDEIIPLWLGGDDTDPDNCRLLCHQCHFSGPSGALTARP